MSTQHAAASQRGALHDLELVVVTYHSRRLVEALLADLPPTLPVVLVDNARGADGLAELARARGACRWFDGGGVGFARAANAGARVATAEYIVFVNPDTSPTIEQLEALTRELEQEPTLAAVSATTVSADGRVELGVGGWEPSVVRAVVYATGLHALLPRAGLFARPSPGEHIELDWLTGACLAVPRRRFLELGGFDESFFLYNEDVAYGRRVREAGFGQRLRTDLLVPHQGAGSGGAKPLMLQQRGASMMTYVAQHHGRGTTVSIKLVLTAGMVGRWSVSQVRGRREAASGFAAYVRGLWHGPPDLRG